MGDFCTIALVLVFRAMSRFGVQSAVIVALTVCLLTASPVAAQDRLTFDLDEIDTWTAKVRREAGLDTIRDLAETLQGADREALVRITELAEGAMEDHLWETEDRLSSRGSAYFESELEIIQTLQEALRSDRYAPAQRESLLQATGYFLSADAELVDQEIAGLEALAVVKGCDQPRARHCDDLLPKLAGSVHNLETAGQEVEAGNFERAIVWMQAGWKKADRTYRRYPASTEEALAEIERLVGVIDATGCAGEPTSQRCIEADRRVFQARRKVQRGEIELERGDLSKSREHYENAWRIAHEAILDLPPVPGEEVTGGE